MDNKFYSGHESPPALQEGFFFWSIRSINPAKMEWWAGLMVVISPRLLIKPGGFFLMLVRPFTSGLSCFSHKHAWGCHAFVERYKRYTIGIEQIRDKLKWYRFFFACIHFDPVYCLIVEGYDLSPAYHAKEVARVVILYHWYHIYVPHSKFVQQ